MDDLNNTIEIVRVQNQINIYSSRLLLPIKLQFTFSKAFSKMFTQVQEKEKKFHNQTHDASLWVEFIQNVKQFKLENFVQKLQYNVWINILFKMKPEKCHEDIIPSLEV